MTKRLTTILGSVFFLLACVGCQTTGKETDRLADTMPRGYDLLYPPQTGFEPGQIYRIGDAGDYQLLIEPPRELADRARSRKAAFPDRKSIRLNKAEIEARGGLRPVSGSGSIDVNDFKSVELDLDGAEIVEIPLADVQAFGDSRDHTEYRAAYREAIRSLGNTVVIRSVIRTTALRYIIRTESGSSGQIGADIPLTAGGSLSWEQRSEDEYALIIEDDVPFTLALQEAMMQTVVLRPWEEQPKQTAQQRRPYTLVHEFNTKEPISSDYITNWIYGSTGPVSYRDESVSESEYALDTYMYARAFEGTPYDSVAYPYLIRTSIPHYLSIADNRWSISGTKKFLFSGKLWGDSGYYSEIPEGGHPTGHKDYLFRSGRPYPYHNSLRIFNDFIPGNPHVNFLGFDHKKRGPARSIERFGHTSIWRSCRSRLTYELIDNVSKSDFAQSLLDLREDLLDHTIDLLVETALFDDVWREFYANGKPVGLIARRARELYVIQPVDVCVFDNPASLGFPASEPGYLDQEMLGVAQDATVLAECRAAILERHIERIGWNEMKIKRLYLGLFEFNGGFDRMASRLERFRELIRRDSLGPHLFSYMVKDDPDADYESEDGWSIHQAQEFERWITKSRK